MDQDQTVRPVGQKYLGDRGLLGLIIFLAAFIPLSIDMYLPALPRMAEHLNAPMHLVSLTLVIFFVFFALGSLIWGPLSDKYGRRTIILIGLGVYIAASLLCAAAQNIHQLIFFRACQAIGGGSASAVATAMVKDAFDGRRRESVLVIVQAMVILAPIIAPIIGALVLGLTSWRGVFVTLAGIGVLALGASLFLTETLTERQNVPLPATLGRLGVVLKNPGFTVLWLVFSAVPLPMMAFIAASSFIYVGRFGLTEQHYSYFFALNASFAMAGPFLYLRLSRFFRAKWLIVAAFGVMILSGAAVIFFGPLGPWAFALAVIPSTAASSSIRPPSTNLMLEQQRRDTGSAASLMTCGAIFMGSLGMFAVSLDWPDLIVVIGLLQALVGLGCGLLWLILSGRPFIKPVPDTRAPSRR